MILTKLKFEPKIKDDEKIKFFMILGFYWPQKRNHFTQKYNQISKSKEKQKLMKHINPNKVNNAFLIDLYH